MRRGRGGRAALDDTVRDGYLNRLGIAAPPRPGLETLVALHRAHLARVPYDNLDIMLDRPLPVEPMPTAHRVAAGGRAGYCFHLNAAFGALLDTLGYRVSRRHAHVWTHPEGRHATGLNHLALVVHGLPTDDNPGGDWWADVGLGDAFVEPLALRDGITMQRGWRYELAETKAGWSLRHDPLGAFRGVEMGRRPPAGIGAAHERLSRAADSSFTRLLAVLRRDATGVDVVRSCLLLRVEPSGCAETELDTYDDWRSALTDGLGLPVADVADDELRRLWTRTRSGFLRWDAAGRP